MKPDSKTFCVYPWIHQQATPPGKINFCCISMHSFVEDNSGRPMSLDKDSFQAAWNVDYMKSLRKKMIQGEKIKGCETCYKQEELGKRSYRQSHNDEWFDRVGHVTLEKIIKKSVQKDYVVDSEPLCLDLRLGNLCNLKCRTCNPYNSIQIYKEWEELDKKSDHRYSKFWKEHGLEFGGCSQWYESENFWKSVEKAIPSLQKVYITGGEPALIEGNYAFLNKCKEMGFAKNIDLFFNTNMTILRDGFIELLNEFRSVRINASLDAYGEGNEYIRAPSRWNAIDKNFKTIAKEGGENLILGISPVIQIYNILNITELFNYVENVAEEFTREISIDFLFCFNPKFLNIAQLPDNVKREALNRLKDFKNKSKTYHLKTSLSFYVKDGIDSMTSYLEKTMGQESSPLMRNFMEYTKTLDQQREQSFSQSFPDLSELLVDAGYSLDRSESIIATNFN